MSRAYLWPTVLILSTGLALITQKIDLPVVSPLMMAWFLLVCPGLAIVQLLPIQPLSNQIGLVVALSIALNAIIAEFMAFTHLWSPTVAFLLLGCLTVTCALYQVHIVRQARRAAAGQAAVVAQPNSRAIAGKVAPPPLLVEPTQAVFERGWSPLQPTATRTEHAQSDFIQQMYYRPKRPAIVNRGR